MNFSFIQCDELRLNFARLLVAKDSGNSAVLTLRNRASTRWSRRSDGNPPVVSRCQIYTIYRSSWAVTYRHRMDEKSESYKGQEKNTLLAQSPECPAAYQFSRLSWFPVKIQPKQAPKTMQIWWNKLTNTKETGSAARKSYPICFYSFFEQSLHHS